MWFKFGDNVGLDDSTIPSVVVRLDMVYLSEAAAEGGCHAPGTDNRSEEEAHDVADLESAGVDRETEVSPLRRFRSVVDNLIDCWSHWQIKLHSVVISGLEWEVF